MKSVIGIFRGGAPGVLERAGDILALALVAGHLLGECLPRTHVFAGEGCIALLHPRGRLPFGAAAGIVGADGQPVVAGDQSFVSGNVQGKHAVFGGRLHAEGVFFKRLMIEHITLVPERQHLCIFACTDGVSAGDDGGQDQRILHRYGGLLDDGKIAGHAGGIQRQRHQRFKGGIGRRIHNGQTVFDFGRSYGHIRRLLGAKRQRRACDGQNIAGEGKGLLGDGLPAGGIGQLALHGAAQFIEHLRGSRLTFQRTAVCFYLRFRPYGQRQQRARHGQYALDDLAVAVVLELAPQERLSKIRRTEGGYLAHVIQREGVQPCCQSAIEHAAFFQQLCDEFNRRSVRLYGAEPAHARRVEHNDGQARKVDVVKRIQKRPVIVLVLRHPFVPGQRVDQLIQCVGHLAGQGGIFQLIGRNVFELVEQRRTQ